MSQKEDNTEVLSYKIDTAEFDKGMEKVIAALEKVEKREYLTKLQASVDGLSTGMENISFSGMEQSLSSIEDRFTTMGVVGMSVISNLTTGVLDLAERFVFDKVLANAVNGFEELNIQIGSTQTILANTGDRFGTTLTQVNQGLDSLNEYADKTIYNFSNMTQAVGAFTSAGVDLGNSTQAIKGVANMAAYAGASAESASSGMYQFSNALSMGYMMLYQWNSLVYSGLGTKQLENELISSARGLGVDIDAILKEYGGMFRYSLEAGWVDSKVLMHTMAKYSGEVTEDQLKKMKYTKEEIARILKLGQTAEDAATKVISYEKLITSLNESVGSGWAKTFKSIIGDFEQGKALFTMISENLLAVIERGAENRNKLVGDWAKFGGRDVVVTSIDKLLKTYSGLLLVVGQALNQVFPPVTGRQVATATKLLGKLIDKLIPTSKGLNNIGKLIRGFASAVDIPIQFFKALARYLYLLIKPMLKFKFTWVDTIVSLAEFMTKLRKEIIKGDLFFKKITSWGNSFKLFIDKIKQYLNDLSKMEAVKKMREIFDAITMRLGMKDPEFLKKFLSDAALWFQTFFKSFDKASALETIDRFITNIIDFGKRVYRFLEPAILYVTELVTNFGKAFGLALKDLSTNFTWDKFKDVFGILTKFLTLKTVITIIERLGYAGEIFMTLGMGFAKSIGYFSTAIKQFANSNDADTMLSVAAAIGILSASVFMLATLPKEGLDRGIKAITTIYAGLAGSLMALNAILNGSDTLTNMVGGSLKLALLPPVLIALAVSVAIMADTLTKLGAVPFKQIVKGFIGLSGILAILTVFLAINKKAGAMTLSSGLGFLALSVSLTVLAKSLEMFSKLKYEDIGKAAVAVGGLMVMISIMSAAKVVGPHLLILAATITGIAGSVVLLGLAFKYLGSIDFVTIATGLTNLLVMLGALYFAVFVGNTMRATTIAKIGLVAIAIAGLGLAFTELTKINPEAVILASTGAALSIGILYAAVSFIKPTIIASVAGLLALSAGVAAFALALTLFEGVDFKAVALGGAALGVLILALAGLGALATAFPPLIAGMGAIAAVILVASGAFMLFGAGVLFVGTGVKLLAEGLVLLADGGTRLMDSLIVNIPKFGEALVKLVTVSAEALTKIAPQIASIGVTIIIALCTAIINSTPYIAEALITVISALIGVLVALTPQLNDALFIVIKNILTNLDKHAGTYVVLWNRFITKVLNGMAATSGPQTKALYNYLIALVRGLADAVEQQGPELGTELNRLALSLFKFFVESMVVASDTLDEGLEWFTSYMTTGAGKKLYEKLPSLSKIGLFFVKGIVSGMMGQSAAGFLSAGADWIANMLINRTKAGLDEHSPSEKGKEIGAFWVEGIALGINPDKMKSKLDLIKNAMLGFMDGQMDPIINLQPMISPVLDLGAMAAIEKTIAAAFGSQQLAFTPGSGYSLYNSPRLQQQLGPEERETVVFKQTISSAAPLSVEEVARRTASLVGQSRRKS